uniref:CMP-sialic acid transporter 2 n=2 Tax=Rhizophora mucronata TaxID=61149 RepID=A0A2P2MQF0_RHIMU
MKNGMLECSVCHSKLVSPSSRTVSKAYDQHKSRISSKQRALNFFLVVGDCILVGLQPVLVYMSKVDGGFKFSPISVNFLTEGAKVLFAIVMLLFQVQLIVFAPSFTRLCALFINCAHNSSFAMVLYKSNGPLFGTVENFLGLANASKKK